MPQKVEALCKLVPAGAGVEGSVGSLRADMQVRAGKRPGAAWTWWEGKPWLSCKNTPQFAQTRHLRAPVWAGDVLQPLEIHLSSDG